MRVFIALASLILVSVSFATPGHAGLRDDIAACAAIADDGTRLACFDALDTSPAAAATAPTTAMADALKK